MDNETRNRLRMLRDLATRRIVEKDRRIKHPPVLCIDCKTDLDAWTAGCRACLIRHYGRMRRGVYPGGEVAYRRTAKAKQLAAMSLWSESVNAPGSRTGS